MKPISAEPIVPSPFKSKNFISPAFAFGSKRSPFWFTYAAASASVLKSPAVLYPQNCPIECPTCVQVIPDAANISLFAPRLITLFFTVEKFAETL